MDSKSKEDQNEDIQANIEQEEVLEDEDPQPPEQPINTTTKINEDKENEADGENNDGNEDANEKGSIRSSPSYLERKKQILRLQSDGVIKNGSESSKDKKKLTYPDDSYFFGIDNKLRINENSGIDY